MGDGVHEADLQFEHADAGASTTYPMEAGKVRKGGHLVIRGRPCKIPNVARTDYNLLNISEDGFLDLMMDNGDTREDLTLPDQTEEDKKLGEQVRTDFAAGKELVLSVLKAMDDEKIIAAKVNT